MAPTRKGYIHVCWKDENIHSKYWWKKKLELYSEEIDFRISNFWSYLLNSSFKLIANKILIIGRKK
jgi:hypothetical protein